MKESISANKTIFHYRILHKLGAGGMGEVYLAQDTKLDRKVAIKFLPAELSADETARRRLMREAQAAAKLNHPNICAVHEVGEVDSQSYIVMQHVEGETLAARLERQSLGLQEVLNIATQVADAIAEAHSLGIIHRDIKPQNMMITARGQVKVLDFGLARVSLDRDPLKSEADTQSLLTEPGTIVGTVAYMSPEQASGKTVDARSDIFSFGSVLYEMVTRQRAFRGNSPMETLAAVLNQEPAPLSGKVPDELAKIILRCLRKDPARRYQTMADLKVALEDEREGPGSVSTIQARARRPWVAAALIVMMLIAALFAWQALRPRPSAEPLRAVSLTTERGAERYPSFSPEGDRVAFTWTGKNQDNPDIYVQQIATGALSRLTTDLANDYNPVWSPDGQWIAFLRLQAKGDKSELLVIPSSVGGVEHKVTDVRVRDGTFVTPPYLAWCPDGDCLVVTDSPDDEKPAALFAVSRDTGDKRRLTNPQSPSSGDANPAVSPDGNWLVFRRSASGLFSNELYRVPLGKGLTVAGEPKRLTPPEVDANFPTWMPDSKEILFSSRGSLWRLIVPGENTPARLPFVGEDGLMPVVARSQPGHPARLVYVRSFEDFNICRVDTAAPGARASSLPVPSISSTRADDMPQLSPNGGRVAFASNRLEDWEIWLANPDGSNAAPLTSMKARVTGYPHWSPDGNQIVFHSTREGQTDVYAIAVAGGKPRNLTSNPARDSFPSFSRDGKWIYFTSNRTGEDRIWKIPGSGGDAIQVTNCVGYAPLESPDGADLYYVQTMFTPSSLWRLPASGGDPVKVLEGVVLGNFAVLEGGIYYIDRPSGEGAIYSIDRPSGETRLQYFDFATRKSTTVARSLGDVDLPLTASSDGRTIFYARIDETVDDLMLVENFR